MVRNNDGAVWLAVGKADENQVKLLSFFLYRFSYNCSKKISFNYKIATVFF